jgi:hypothetical protein
MRQRKSQYFSQSYHHMTKTCIIYYGPLGTHETSHFYILPES